MNIINKFRDITLDTNKNKNIVIYDRIKNGLVTEDDITAEGTIESKM